MGWRSNGVKGVTALVVGRLWRRCAAAAREEGRQRHWAPPRPAPPLPPTPRLGQERSWSELLLLVVLEPLQ
jgi:hypothetical protein